MRRYIFKRLVFSVPLVLGIVSLAFLLVHVAPGGPFDKERRPASPEIEQHIKAKYHLNEPVWKQYLRFVGSLAHGDFGPSLKYRNHDVNDIILQALPVSLSLGALSFCFAMGFGLPMGFLSAVRKNQWPDFLSSFLALLAICIPSFVVGPLLVMGFALKWRWFPVALWGSPMEAVLPMLTLGLYFAGRIARLMREGLATVLPAEYLVAARAKGLSETAVLLRHALPLALLPVVSYSGPMIADLLTGSFVVENLFHIPGMGMFMVNSSLDRDYPMVVGLVLVYAVLLVLLNLLVDVAYHVLDPRVKYE